ncbi:MAG: hypothetical protein ACM31L_09500 [Actinomycetota bacterium]
MIYAEALAWTYAIEVPVVVAAGALWGCGVRRSAVAAVLASGVTHPVAWSVALAMPMEAYYRWGWHIIEATVCAVEAVVLGRFMRLPGKRSWPLSIVANGLSALAGRYLF